MKRPIIKGTPLHKASIAKAESDSIVSQYRTQADSTLVESSKALGKSLMPESQDYKLNKYNLDNIEDKRVRKNKKDTDTTTLETEDSDYTDEDIQADLDRITAEQNENNTTTTSKKKPYENWKIRAEKENIRLAEENKARLDEASAKRVANKAKAENKKNNTNFDYSPKTDPESMLAPEVEYKKREKSDVRVMSKEELSAAREKSMREKLITLEEAKEVGEGGEVSIETDIKEANERALQKEKSRVQTKKENRLDKAIAERNIKTSDKEDARLEKQAEIDEKNKVIKNKNKTIADAKEYYNTEKLTKTQLEDYNETIRRQKAEENEPEIEIIEEDDPDPGLDEYNRIKALNSNTPQNEAVTTEVSENKPRVSDFKGNFFEKQKQYKEAMKLFKDKYDNNNSKSPTEMRDDRVYQFASKDGPVRKNMIKSGYTPKN